MPCLAPSPEFTILGIGFLTVLAISMLFEPYVMKVLPVLKKYRGPLAFVLVFAAGLMLSDTSLLAVSPPDCNDIWKICEGGCFCMIIFGCWCGG